jgi:hypothetical protein
VSTVGDLRDGRGRGEVLELIQGLPNFRLSQNFSNYVLGWGVIIESKGSQGGSGWVNIIGKIRGLHLMITKKKHFIYEYDFFRWWFLFSLGMH